ncbi:MAG: hypothetical protein JWO93_2906 [Micrococcaceae bacterium]|nr:hypothetical protein [Micrococcaceae bacterium]
MERWCGGPDVQDGLSGCREGERSAHVESNECDGDDWMPDDDKMTTATG